MNRRKDHFCRQFGLLKLHFKVELLNFFCGKFRHFPGFFNLGEERKIEFKTFLLDGYRIVISLLNLYLERSSELYR